MVAGKLLEVGSDEKTVSAKPLTILVDQCRYFYGSLLMLPKIGVLLPFARW